MRREGVLGTFIDNSVCILINKIIIIISKISLSSLLEWGGCNRVISAGYSQTLSTSSVVRNEILCTDIRNGLTKIIRPEVDESPVELLRASFYQLVLLFSVIYFSVVFDTFLIMSRFSVPTWPYRFAINRWKSGICTPSVCCDECHEPVRLLSTWFGTVISFIIVYNLL